MEALQLRNRHKNDNGLLALADFDLHTHSISNLPTQLTPPNSNLATYLARRHNLQGPQRRLQILGVALEIEQSTGNSGLQLRRVLLGWRVLGDLDESSHFGRGRGQLDSAAGLVGGGSIVEEEKSTVGRSENEVKFNVGASLRTR